MVEAGSDNLLAQLEPPPSPGVTSLLRGCFEDEDEVDEADSSCLFQALQQRTGIQTWAAADCALSQPTQPVLYTEAPIAGSLDGSHAEQPRLAPSADSSQPFPMGTTLFGGGSGLAASQVAAFTLDHTDAVPSHPAACGGPVRRRGRKPKPRLPDLRHKLDDLTKQYQRLTNENENLKNKLKVLERVVPYRDESVGFLTQLLSTPAQAAQEGPESRTARPSRILQDGRAQSPASSGDSDSCSGPIAGAASEAKSSRTQATATNTTAGTSDSGDRGVSCTGHAMGDGRTAAAVTAATAVWDGRGWPLLGSRATSTSPPLPSRGPRGGTPAVIALCPSPDGEVPAITAAVLEELKRTTGQEFRMLWKQICLQLGVLVTGAEVHGPGSSPYVRLERFLERALAYMDKITLLSPACFVQSMYMNVETGQPERPSDNFWITCARALQLTPQQLAEVNTLAAVYEQEVMPVVQQRLRLSMQLSERLGAATNQTSSGGDALTTLSAVDELAQQLERNVLKEHQAHWNIGDFLCSSVLTPLQVAKALTVAYPYIPDGVAMLHAFKLLRTGEANQAAQRPGHQVATGQPFPSLAGLLMGQLPAVVGAMAAAGRPAPEAVTQQHLQAGRPGVALGGGGVAGLQTAQLQALATAMQPAQLQALTSALQPAQVQALMAALQPSHLQALTTALQPAQLQAALAGLQAASLLGRLGGQQAQATQSIPTGTAQVQSGASTAAQMQGLAALLQAVAASGQRH